MAERESAQLRRLAAELRSEATRIDRSVAEAVAARPDVTAPEASRLALYGVAALLDIFYTGVEKAMLRIAHVFGETPVGPAWQRELLEAMALDIPKLRPPVLAPETVRELERFLAFRHRFRNLYLFDLRIELVAGALDELPAVWQRARRELEAFSARLEGMADRIERP